MNTKDTKDNRDQALSSGQSLAGSGQSKAVVASIPPINLTAAHKWPIGTKYLPPQKHAGIRTVVDVHYTYNQAGELARWRYVAEHDFLGQRLRENDITETTVSRGVWNLNKNSQG